MLSRFYSALPWARLVERSERSLYARDTNRRSLPFEWGSEHVGLPASGDEYAALREFAARATANSDEFFACAPGGQWELDGDLLRFPSALETPYPENNTVWGRFFEGEKDLAVVVLPQWNCPWNSQFRLCEFLQRMGIASLRLSLPYHHHRKPAHLERSEYTVSPNIGRTMAASRQAVLDIRRAADWLQARGHRRLAILGSSIGSCVGFLAFAHDPRFSAAAFIHVSSYFADVVWSGISTKHVRSSLETAVTLPQLRTLWEPISPYPFIQKLSGSNRKLLMISGRYDLSFLPELSEQGYVEFDRWGISHERVWLPCGHYTMARFPFSAMAGYRIIKFLRSNRT